MNIKIFNYCIIGGWLLILIGGMVVNVGYGLIGGGVSMIFLTLLGVRLSGGLVSDPEPVPASADEHEAIN